MSLKSSSFTLLASTYSDDKALFQLGKDKRDKLIAHYFFNKLKNKKTFKAICLSGGPQAEQAIDPSGSMGTYYPIKVRPLDIHNFILPDPCSKEYADESKTLLAQQIISMHPTAWGKRPMIAGERTPGFGEELEVEFTTGAPSAEGRMRGLRYNFPSQQSTYDYKCANQALQALVGQFQNDPALLMGTPGPPGEPATVPGFDPKTLPSKDYNTILSPAVPYKENRVLLSHFGSVSCESDIMTETGYGRKAHVLVVKRFKLLQEAFVAETGMEPLKVTSACRPHRWKSRASYNAKMVKKYGSVKEGRKWVAFASPHESGLALDVVHSKKPKLYVDSKAAISGRLQKSPAFIWLKNNAHRWGFTPYKREPWHWELKIPYESWRTGQEFVTDSNYAVRVKETKK